MLLSCLRQLNITLRSSRSSSSESVSYIIIHNGACVCVKAPTSQLGLTRLGLETRPSQQERVLFYVFGGVGRGGGGVRRRATKAAAGDNGGGGRRRRRRATKAAAGDEGGGGRSCHLNFQGAQRPKIGGYTVPATSIHRILNPFKLLA
jgi:hypothetical protein